MGKDSGLRGRVLRLEGRQCIPEAATSLLRQALCSTLVCCAVCQGGGRALREGRGPCCFGGFIENVTILTGRQRRVLLLALCTVCLFVVVAVVILSPAGQDVHGNPQWLRVDADALPADEELALVDPGGVLGGGCAAQRALDVQGVQLEGLADIHTDRQTDTWSA